MKKIVLTGGGSAGHVTPNIALMPELKKRGYDMLYIGSVSGIERDIVAKTDVPYEAIDSGKLRRYFDLKNFTDPFRVIHGYAQARKILRKYSPDVVFSKGGFVSVPVVLAAHALKIPVVLHESDITPGLANKICIRFANKICCNFSEAVETLPSGRAFHTGTPIRHELYSGSRQRALEFTGLSGQRDVLLVIGGSLGSVAINKAIRANLPSILRDFDIVHICGKGNVDVQLKGKYYADGYRQYEFITEQLPDVFALTSIAISRAGANAIFELVSLQIPHILIPLSRAASRGDQILNARSFEKHGFSYVLEEEQLPEVDIAEIIRNVYDSRDAYIHAMESSGIHEATTSIADIIDGEIS